MSDSATVTRDQLLTVVISTELGGRAGDSSHFSYAELANSTYSFGPMQFDVGNGGHEVKVFLKENGFDDTDITNLSRHGGLSRKELDALDVKLQAIPQAKMDQFTNQQLDVTIGRVGDIIDNVRKQNPAAADAMVKDAKLQLGVADYANQFSPRYDDQLAGFMAGKRERGIQAGNPPTREDMQNFIGSTPYGRDPANARGIAGREERFNEAMAELKLGPATKAPGHTSDKAGSILLNAPAHPDHKLFQQAYDGIKKLDAQHGRASDQHSENLAGALTVEAKAQGLKRIDMVALSDDGSKAFAAHNVIPGAFKNVAGVETAQAVHIPMEQSTQQMAQVNQTLQQQAQAQVQTQNQNQTSQATQGPQMGGLSR